MPGKRFKAEEIVNKLRQADVELARGSTVAAVRPIPSTSAHAEGLDAGEPERSKTLF